MEVTKGKMKHIDSGSELVFGINPSQFELSQTFDFALEPRIASPSPLVSFRCGGAATLKFSLVFDRDAGAAEDAIKKVQRFLQEAHQVDTETQTVSAVDIKLGSMAFRGFIRSYRFTATRFDPKGEPLSARLDMELISDGSYEAGKGNA
jgi:hypothetical protein